MSVSGAGALAAFALAAHLLLGPVYADTDPGEDAPPQPAAEAADPSSEPAPAPATDSDSGEEAVEPAGESDPGGAEGTLDAGKVAAPQQSGPTPGPATSPGFKVRLPLFEAPPTTPDPGKQAADPEGKQGHRSGVEAFFENLGLFQGVTITGQNTFTFQEHAVQGSAGAFQSQRWDTGNLVHQSSLQVQGPIWRDFMFQASVSESGWGPSYSRWITGYMARDTAVLYGDLDLSVSGNQFLGFRKSTRGWQLDQRLPGNGLVRGFYTREKGVTRNQTFPGNDTPGPYFLTFTPIIEDSETVKVNEQPMRFGRDYRLDYDTGQLWFEPIDGRPRIITASDAISVSYQSLGYINQGPGQIYGARAEMPLLGDRAMVGVTVMQQDRSGGGQLLDTVGYQEDVYHGSGTTGPFDTNFRPIIPDETSVVYKGERLILDRPLVVLVDGTEQLEGVDYDSYRQIGRVIFRRAVPPTSLVFIKYYYDIAGQRPAGDFGAWGVDVTYRIAPGLNMALDWASSNAGAGGQDGGALSTTVNYSRDRLNLLAEYRAIDPTFSFMDSVGFQRREKGINLGGEWRVNDHISLTNRFSSADSDSGFSFGYSGYGGGYGFSGGLDGYAMAARTTPTTGLGIRTSRNDTAVRVSYPGWPDFSLQRNSMSNRGGASGESDYTTNSIQMSYAPPGAGYTVRSSFNRTRQENRSVSSAQDGTPTVRGSTSDQLQTSVTYTPMDGLSLAASIATSGSSAIETVNTSAASNYQFTARWSPTTRFNMDLSQTSSRSDGRVSSGFYGDQGFGGSSPTYGGTPPYSGYIPPGGGGTVPGDDQEPLRPSSADVSRRMGLNWRPLDNLSLDLSLGQRRYDSTGSQGYLADSNQQFWNVGAMWQLSDALAFNMAVGSDNLKFLDADRGAVTNRSYVLSGSYRPSGQRWSTGLTLNMQDGSSPTFVGYGRLQRYRVVPTKLFDINGQISYSLSEDLSLQASAGISDFSGGYADFRKNNAELRARYRLSNATGMDFGYRFIRNISRGTDDGLIYGPSGAGQNYLANTFLLSLNTSFYGGMGTSGRDTGRRTDLGGGFAGTPGTFGGFRAGLQTPGYGTGMGYDPFGGGGYGSSIGRRTDYGTSAFDTLGSYDLNQQRSTGMDIFGPGSPWSSPQQQEPTRRSKDGDLSEGLGDFRRTELAPPPFESGRAPGERPTLSPEDPAQQERRPAILEDWWLLDDNLSSW